MIVLIKHFPQERPDGDRSTTKTKCHRYEAYLRRSPEDEVLIDKADDWDSYQCFVDNKRSAFYELRTRMRNLADFLKTDLMSVMMEEHQVTETTWSEKEAIDTY